MSGQINQVPAADEMAEDALGFWRETGKQLVRASIDAIDGAAKQIIAVAGILEGLYFHAIAFSDLKSTLQGTAAVVYVMPVIFLMLSLAAALGIFFPDQYRLNFNAPKGVKAVYEDVVRTKMRLLKLSALFLLLGSLAIGATIYVYVTT